MATAMKLIYIAGKYRAPNAWAIEQNIRRAEELGLVVYDLGAQPVIPHSMNRFYQGRVQDAVALEGTLALLARCDGILMVNGWRESTGATAELEFAEKKRMPIFYESSASLQEDLAFFLHSKNNHDVKRAMR